MPCPRRAAAREPAATRRRLGRLGGLLIALPVCLLALPAGALQSARSASGTQVLAAGRYQAVLALTSARTFPPVPLVLDIPAASTDSVFLNAVNIGTLPLSGGYYALTVVPNASGGLGRAALALRTCTGTWNGSVGQATCSTGEAGLGAIDVTGNVLSPRAPLAVTPAGKSLQLTVVRSDPSHPTRVRLDLALHRGQAPPARTLSS